VNAKNLQTSFVFLALAIVLVLVFFVYAPFLQVLAVAAMAAVVTHRFYDRLSRLLGGWNGISAFLTVLAVLTLLVTPIAILGTKIFAESAGLYHAITTNRSAYVATVEQGLSQTLQTFFPGYTFHLDMYAQQGLTWLTGNLGKVFSGTVEVIVDLLLFLIAFFYFLKDGRRFTRALKEFSPLPAKYSQDILDRLEAAIDSMVRGQLLIALIQGVLAGTGFSLFGLPNPAVWGCVAALCALVPGLGTSLVHIPAVLFLFATGQTWQAVGLLIWVVTTVATVDNTLAPFLIGKGARIHPLFVLFAVLGGLAFFGPLGFLLGPLAVSLLIALLDVYKQLVLKK
jgi:predicted PurR-regulated permease PerM